MSEPSASDAAAGEPAAEKPAVSEQTVAEPEVATSAEETALDVPVDPEAAGRVRKPLRQVPRPSRSVAVLTLAVVGISIGVYLAASSSPTGQKATGDVSRNVVSTSSAGESTAARVGAGAVPGRTPGASTAAHGNTPGARTAAHGNSAPASSHGQSADTPKPLKPPSPVRVRAWNKGPAGAALSQVTSHASTVLMAHGVGQYPQMLQACRALSASVQAAEALPPIPDAAMQQLYTKSLAAFSSGTAKCLVGISQRPEGDEDTVTQVNQVVIHQALNLFSVGMSDLYVATEVLRKQ